MDIKTQSTLRASSNWLELRWQEGNLDENVFYDSRSFGACIVLVDLPGANPFGRTGAARGKRSRNFL
jgi:hypothetical protein